ncbi:hypothetical protein Fmac_026266 [Flemingia macrophylla]|uniref:Probable magnesium transporter n=1 Tax=Flemingia macrophylla TaxID=520843 RepID=A0ABD1LEH1_9FABA
MDMGSVVLAHFLLKEKLQKMGMLGCLLCIVGSTVVVLHALEEKFLTSVQEIWELAIQPAFLSYTASAIHCDIVFGFVLVLLIVARLILWFIQEYAR